MKVRFFNPGKGYQKIKSELLPEIDRVLSEGQLILRKDVEDFETSVAEYVGTKYCVALNSCTDALYLALRGLKIGPGDEVLVPSRTFVASAQVIGQVGATPVFYDLDGKLTITDKTKAIIPVHIEGAFDNHFTEIMRVAEENNLYVIEDAAQAFGAVQNGKKAGSSGIAGCFSFYPAKTLGAYGDAGALVTNDEELYKWVRDARNHFKEDARDWGVNSRLDNLQAVILNVKFKYYEEALRRRKEIADRYLKELNGAIMPPDTEGRIWQDFIVRTEKRDELFNFLKDNGIETLKNNYPFPVSKLPMAQEYEDQTLRLPCNEILEEEEVDFIIKKFNEFYQE
jgi:dTDP-4-amino-4,6-dideoxygalactose transaminase